MPLLGPQPSSGCPMTSIGTISPETCTIIAPILPYKVQCDLVLNHFHRVTNIKYVQSLIWEFGNDCQIIEISILCVFLQPPHTFYWGNSWHYLSLSGWQKDFLCTIVFCFWCSSSLYYYLENLMFSNSLVTYMMVSISCIIPDKRWDVVLSFFVHQHPSILLS